MDFSSLVLMERDKNTNAIIKEMGSYQVSDGAEYITKMFYDGEKINLYFDTKNDVEEWEFSAIFDLFDEEVFLENGYSIETIEDEYNPTWIVRFDYDEEHEVVEENLRNICKLINDSLTKVFEDIKGKRNEYE